MIVRTPAEIGHLVRGRRRRLGWKQDELARRVGVSRQWVVDLEKGKPGTRLDLVLRTLRELDALLSVTDGATLRRRAGKSLIDRVLAESRGPRR